MKDNVEVGGKGWFENQLPKAPAVHNGSKGILHINILKVAVFIHWEESVFISQGQSKHNPRITGINKNDWR